MFSRLGLAYVTGLHKPCKFKNGGQSVQTFSIVFVWTAKAAELCEYKNYDVETKCERIRPLRTPRTSRSQTNATQRICTAFSLDGCIEH